ncbi:hypothetical protein [Vibrio hyugaensis]|uniref:hypothetical protein n=1 Tax=Vibrio hyugaensis TaxID=1534743 RepID=UPI000CE4DF71
MIASCSSDAVGEAFRKIQCGTEWGCSLGGFRGTPTQDNDLRETRPIKNVLGKDAYRTPVSSTKSYTEHLVGASGAMEDICCLKSISTGKLLGTSNLAKLNPHCDLSYLPNAQVETCLNRNFGFAGHNSALFSVR